MMSRITNLECINNKAEIMKIIGLNGNYFVRQRA